MLNDNEVWAKKFISKWDKSYNFSWSVYNNLVSESQNSKYNCLDIGCGNESELAEDLQFKIKLGTDLLAPQDIPALKIPFVQSDLYFLAFKNKCFDLILLRFVVEHIEFPQKAMQEISRILKPNGKIIILTTNIFSPIIFLPKLLPYKFRKKLILKIFGVAEDDIFPTYHRINSKRAIKKFNSLLFVQKWQYIQATSWNRKWTFSLFFFWHLLTKWFWATWLRSNIITVLRKTNS